ncbi:hypothetical protein PC114_g24124 [Phytophthora cactorum]|nr:hypothetical protein PC114_g24124 [Phytophthora cactorum]
MSGELGKLDADEARLCGKIADEYEVDESGLLLYCPCVKKTDGERDLVAKLVVPEQQDVLHHYHASLEGGHQQIGRMYQLIRSHFHWCGLPRVCHSMRDNVRIVSLGKGVRAGKTCRGFRAIWVVGLLWFKPIKPSFYLQP